MKPIFKILLAPFAVYLTRHMGAKVTLDTSRYMQRVAFKRLSGVERLLSSMDVEDLTNENIRELAAFAGMNPSTLMKEYCVVQGNE